MVKRSPCKDQICKLDIELLASNETTFTVLGTKLDKAIPPALQTIDRKENIQLFTVLNEHFIEKLKLLGH